MTSLSNVELLGQLLQVGVTSGVTGGETTADPAAEGFVDTLGRRLRELLVQAGADPAEVAALDGQALLAQCMSLLQGQVQMTQTLSHQLLGDEALASVTSVASGKAGETPADLLEWLRLSAGAEDGGELVASGLGVGEEASLTLVHGTASAPSMAGQPGLGEEASLTLARQLLQGIRTEVAGSDREASRASWSPDGAVALASANGQDASLASAAPWRWLDQASGRQGLALVPPADQTDVRLTDPLADPAGIPGDAGSSVDDDADADAQPASPLGLVGSLVAERQNPAVRAQVLDLSRLLQPGGEEGLTEQVTWMMRSGSGSAELKLYPANLGALDVRITLEDDQAHVHFVSPHPIVREVIEAALPRLRESLAQEGVTLANVSVSDQTPGGRGEAGQGRAAGIWRDSAAEPEPSDALEEPTVVHTTLSALAGRHDYFA